jgi:hypothetical protein
MIFYVKYESIRFSLNRLNFIEAMEMVRQVYDKSEKPDKIMQWI